MREPPAARPGDAPSGGDPTPRPLSVLQRLPAAPGWHLVYVDADREPPVRFVPVAGWAVVESSASSSDAPPSVAALAPRAGAPRGPEVVPVAEGDDAPVLPQRPGYLGAAAPGESLESWAARARAALRG